MQPFLLKYATYPEGKLENIEFQGQLRILEKGYPIRDVEVASSAVSVDTQEDLRFVREKMLDDPYFNEYKDHLRECWDFSTIELCIYFYLKKDM